MTYNKGYPVILQDENTSIVYGMPKVIKQNGFYTEELPLEKIPLRINELAMDK